MLRKGMTPKPYKLAELTTLALFFLGVAIILFEWGPGHVAIKCAATGLAGFVVVRSVIWWRFG